MLWLRPIDSLDARELKGTEQSNFPFWSPDAKSVAFWSVSDRTLKRLDVLGGTPQKLCDAPQFEGGDWSRQGLILFSANGVIQKVDAASGSCTPVTRDRCPPASDTRFRSFFRMAESFFSWSEAARRTSKESTSHRSTIRDDGQSC